MADELQEHEQVARPVRQRRAGEEVHGRRLRGGRDCAFRELPRETAARARVVLQVMRLVEHDPRPRHPPERADVFRQDVVVHDRPFRIGDRRGAAAFDDADRGSGNRKVDLARPVALHRCGADHEIRSAGRDMAQRDDGLACLPEPHVVSEDGAAAAEQERDAFDLMREEPVTERNRFPVGAVRVVRRQAEQLRKGCRLRIELFAVEGSGVWDSSVGPFDVFRGAEPNPSDRAWLQAWPGRLVHRGVSPSGKQDDGLACGSRSRSSHRTLHAGSGTCAAWLSGLK